MIVTGIDTETTALIANSMKPLAKQPQIIEFYGASYTRLGTSGEDILFRNELELLIHPGKKLGEDTIKITGITDVMLKDAPRFEAVAVQIIDLIESSDEIVAHNLSYDKAVIDFELARLGKTAKWPKRLTCTVEATEFIKGFRLSLSALHELLFGEVFEGAHRAGVDVKAMMRCYAELAKRGDL